MSDTRARTGDFLRLPPREGKPRLAGLTHVLDKGMPLVVLESLLDLAGEYIDVLKLGWGTAYVSHPLRAKIALCRAAGVRVCPGGTLFELAHVQGRLDEYLCWAEALGFDAVEISEGTRALERRERAELVKRLARRFTVLLEVGSKDPRAPVDPDEWVAIMLDGLEGGAAYLIAEGRESGTVGLYDADGSLRGDLLEEIRSSVPADLVIFEAPRKDQQVQLIKELGTHVNLGNIAPDDVISVETLRLGLRSDTFALAGEAAELTLT
jgi:phosphosulfolactate synthase